MTKLKTSLIWLALLSLIIQFGYFASQRWFNDDGGKMPTLAPMLDESKPAVVNIAARGRLVPVKRSPLWDDPFFGRFFRDRPNQTKKAKQNLGSGVIFDAENGLLLTNSHVVENAENIIVTLHDGRSFEGELVGSDPATDVALVKIPAENLSAISLADSDEVRVGDFVLAIGNPFGLGQTVTSGIVSALGRSGLGIEGYENFIQTDASINPGNSGGALVNLRGELVGINTAIFSPNRQSGNVGIGFAIPSNMVRQICEQLIEYGEVKRAYLGVEIQDIDNRLAKAFEIPPGQGAIITSIQKNSAADLAGLQVGDVIMALDSQKLTSANSLRNSVGLLMVGQTIKLDILRDGSPSTIKATVKEALPAPVHPKLAGASFGDIEPDSPYYGRVKGVMIYDVKPGSPAWQAGLKTNDIITSVNQTTVVSLDKFKKLVRNTGKLLFKLNREQKAMLLTLSPKQIG